MSSDNSSKDERANVRVDVEFRLAEPLVFIGNEKACVSKRQNLVDLNGWLLYVDEARALRDWLDRVLP